MRVGLGPLALVMSAACGRIGFDDVAVTADDAACELTPLVDRCAAPAPTGSLRLAGGEYVYHTDRGELVDPAGLAVSHASRSIDGVRIVAVDELRVDQTATLRAIGSQPLAIVGTLIDIGGALDVGARMAVPGAGGFATCDAVAGADDSGGGGGGGGGGFGGGGGAGGSGDSDNGASPPGPSIGGAGGLAFAMPDALRGGCPGGQGGRGDGPGGERGAAGGAVVLVAELVAIQGIVRAGGGGGGGGGLIENQGDAGGGGGGSGGMIAVIATSIDLAGTLAANGGGGGEGGFNFTLGQPGEDARDDAQPARGGHGGSETTNDGASGGAGDVRDGSTPAGPRPAGGGGGGGGSVGHVLLIGPDVRMLGAITPEPALYVSP